MMAAKTLRSPAAGWRAAAGLLVALVAGCVGEAPPGAGGVPGLEIASRVEGPATRLIIVVASHRSPDHRVERVALVAPDGTVTEAHDTARETLNAQDYRGSTIGVGVQGGSRSRVGVGLGIFFGGGATGPPVRRTRATIRVPDPDAYRQAPGAWRIEVTVSDSAGGRKTISEPAPPPEG